MAQNEREEQILHMAFEQQGFKILLSKPTYQNYVFTLQYFPDLIIMELPHICIEQLSFAERIHAFKRTRSIPIIGYGNRVDTMATRGFAAHGISSYLERPLKFSVIIALITRQLKPFNKIVEQRQPVSEIDKDIELILNSEAPPSDKTEAMERHICQLVAFPFTIAKVLNITKDQKSGAGQLSNAITADPAISTHLLKVSNSVFFASANRRINSIKDAIVRIGFTETKKIVMAMSVINIFKQCNKNSGFDRVDYWYHSLATALIAERIARLMGDVNPEEAFLAGLLHDLGMLLQDEYFPTIFDANLIATAQTAGSFFEIQTRDLKVSHVDLLAALFPKWKIPQNITEAIVYHHALESFDNNSDSLGKKLAVCVSIGNTLAKLLHLGRECDEFIVPINNRFFQSAKLPAGITANFIEKILHQVTTFRSFLGLEKREYECSCPMQIDAKEVHIGVYNPERELLVPPQLSLAQHGINFTPVMLATIPEQDGRFSLILYWSTSSVDQAALDQLLRIHGAANASSKEGQPPYVPVLLFAPNPGQIEAAPNLAILPNRFDLRQFELTIAKVVSGSDLSPAPETSETLSCQAAQEKL